MPASTAFCTLVGSELKVRLKPAATQTGNQSRGQRSGTSCSEQFQSTMFYFCSSLGLIYVVEVEIVVPHENSESPWRAYQAQS